MTTFKKFVAAKQAVNEKHIPRTMNQNFFIRKELNENELNEAFAEEPINSGFGSGGEIDAGIAAVGAAGAAVFKAMYNLTVYKTLMSDLPNYIKEYKQWGANKSRDVFEQKYSDAVQKLKKEKKVLLGRGGERSDRDVQDRKTEESAKDKVEKIFKAQIEKAEDAKQHDKAKQLRANRDKALQQIDLKIQNLQKKIEQAEANSEVAWDRGKEKWAIYKEKFEKKQERFIELGGVLGSYWKKKWEANFSAAKTEADLEVLAEAKAIATENNDKNEVEAITKAEQRSQEAMNVAKEAVKEVESEEDKVDRESGSAEEFGVIEYQMAAAELDNLKAATYGKWKKAAESLESTVNNNGEGDIEKIQNQLKAAKEKLANAKEAVKIAKEEGDDNKADNIQSQIAKLESDVQTYEDELEKLKGGSNESLTDSYSLGILVMETISMINQILKESKLFEEENKVEIPPISAIKSQIFKVIKLSPEDKKRDIMNAAIKDVNDIMQAEENVINARNSMVEKFENNRQAEGDAKVEIPDSIKEFSNIKKIDSTERLQPYKSVINALKDEGSNEPEISEPKDKNIDEEPKDKNTDEEPKDDLPDEDTEEEDNPEVNIKKITQNIEDERVTLAKAKEKLKELENDKKSSTNPEEFDKLIAKQQTRIEQSIEDIKELKAEREREKKRIKTESVEPAVAEKPASRFMKFEDYLNSKKDK